MSAAYGWPADISPDEALQELLDLNLARSGAASATADKSYAIGRAAFEKINAVEGINLSHPMKEALKKINTELDTATFVRRLRQIRP